MSRITLIAIVLWASCSAFCSMCASPKQPQEQLPHISPHSRDSLKTKIGLEAPSDVYKFVVCSGGRTTLADMAPAKALCEVALDYADGRVVNCSTHVYEFSPDGVLQNVSVSSALEELFVKKGVPFSFVDAGTASYSFWLDTTMSFDTLNCL